MPEVLTFIYLYTYIHILYIVHRSFAITMFNSRRVSPFQLGALIPFLVQSSPFFSGETKGAFGGSNTQPLRGCMSIDDISWCHDVPLESMIYD